MVDADRAELLASLAGELARPSTEESTAEAVTKRALAEVADADHVSITLKARRRRYVTLAATHELSRRLDELQYALGEGPCISAADTDDWYRSGEVGRDSRWPQWGPKAGSLGIGSLLSVRLVADGDPIGALNFYSEQTAKFADREEVDFALLFAIHAAIALQSSRQASGLQTALHSRHVIGMAQGIMIERFGLDTDGSFDLLRRYSSVTNTRLSAVAEEVVRTRQLPALPEPADPQD